MDKLLTYQEAALRIGVSESRISQLVSAGRLKVERKPETREVRIRESVVEAFISKRTFPEALPSEIAA